MSVKPAILSEDEGGLILFYHSQSFYCQKVLFALYEKGISFRQYEINVAIGEQFSDWFLELNAKGEVPVLKNGSLIIPGASQIINYVERNFAGGAIRDLLPMGSDEKTVSQILQMSRIISRLPIGAISKGAFAHATGMKLNPKMPYIPPVREALLNSKERLISTIQQHASTSSKYSSVLLAKAEDISKQPKSIPNCKEFALILKKLEELLDVVESMLKQGQHKYFLCDTVTILDICFGILLHRLDMLGLDTKLWGNRKAISAYFLRIQHLSSFQVAIPSNISNARAMWGKLPDQYKFAGIGLISASSLGLMGILGKAI